MQVIVCGGRDYADREYVWFVLDDLLAWCSRLGRRLIIREGANFNGADHYAYTWCLARGVPNQRFKARWEDYPHDARQRAAQGPRRNTRMLTEGAEPREYEPNCYRSVWPELVLAFPGGDGTADMCRQAEQAGVRVAYAAQRP